VTLAERVMAAMNGDRRLVAALSLGAGLATALVFPPFGVLPGLLGYGLLMALLDAAPEETRLKSGFWRGWLAGSVYFLVATWWVFDAFLVDAKNQGWMAPIAVALLAAGLGLFWGGAGLVYRWLKPQGLSRPIVFAGVFCLFEWLRGHILTGLPWDLAGESWRAGSAPSQFAALVGAYGLSWITVALAAAPALLIESWPRRTKLAVGGLVVAALVGLYGFGALRLAHPAPPRAHAPIVRVVQANIDQASKYDQAMFESIVHRYVIMTAKPAARVPDIVIWPEGAVPDAANDYLTPGTWTRAAIEGALKPGQTLLLGAYRIGGTTADPLYFNTLLALRRDGAGVALTGVYDKFRLVPFGEYLPLSGILTPLGFKDLTHIGDGFSPGPRPAPLHLAGAPTVQPLICYESLFPGFTREGAARGGRADWIVNVSNDAWFGPTYGPVQHLNIASYRAIEEGLPIVRATPTGVSAVIDAYGRARPDLILGQGVQGVIDTPLPPPLPATLFAQLGDKLFWLLMFLSFILATKGRIPPRKPR
jgi:apolipoprotein N-acyltransferase